MALREVAKRPERYVLPGGGYRPNMIKARDDAIETAWNSLDHMSPGVRAILQAWAEMTGRKVQEANFYKETGFLEALRCGRDIVLRRYIDSDGWAWVSIHDMPSTWSTKTRVSEKIRSEMLRAQRQRRSLW